MKKILITLLLLSLNAKSQALSYGDLAFEMVRQSFKEGTLPKTEDLTINYSWVCKSFKFSKNSTTTYGPGITLNEVFFVNKNNQIINQSIYFPGKVALREYNKNLVSVAISADSGKYLFDYAIRKNHGGLIVESSVPNSEKGDLESIAFQSMKAVSYSYCISHDSRSSAKKVMNIPWGDLYGD